MFSQDFLCNCKKLNTPNNTMRLIYTAANQPKRIVHYRYCYFARSAVLIIPLVCTYQFEHLVYETQTTTDNLDWDLWFLIVAQQENTSSSLHLNRAQTFFHKLVLLLLMKCRHIFTVTRAACKASYEILETHWNILACQSKELEWPWDIIL